MGMGWGTKKRGGGGAHKEGGGGGGVAQPVLPGRQLHTQYVAGILRTGSTSL